MALILKDRVKETTATSGTGSVTLSGAVQGYQGFTSIGDGNTTYYTIAGVAEWEVGIGTYSAGVLSRDTVLGSSANGNKVAFSSGVKDVFCTLPAAKALVTDAVPFTPAFNTASPNATVNVASLTSAVATTNGDVALVPKGTGALLGQVPTSTAAGGNKRGNYAIDWQTKRASADQVASGIAAVIGGGENNKSSNFDSTVAGGSTNQATGIAATVGGGSGNQATGTQSTIAGGSGNYATNSQATISGGRFNQASGQYATIAGGEDITVSGNYSFVGSGQLNSVTATHGVNGGGLSNTVSGTYGAITGGRLNSASAYAFVGGGFTNAVSADYGTIAGGSSNVADRRYTTIGGGSSNTASGASSTDYYATVGGGLGNSANAAKSVIGGGENNSITGIAGTIAGGSANTASALYATVSGGLGNTASGQRSSVVGGSLNTADAKNSTVVGGAYGTARGIIGYAAFPSHDNPIAAALGVSQGGMLVLGRETANNSSTRLRSNALTSSTNNQLILADNSAVYFKGTVIANVTGAGNTKSWTFDGQIKRGSGAASTVLTGSTVSSPYGDAGASGWSVSLAADTTNGGLAVNVVGDVSATVRWVCRLETTEVSF